jgi:hypothetical protein
MKMRLLLLIVTSLLLITLAGCEESWVEAYDPDEEGPYGISLLPEVVRAAFPEAEFRELPASWTLSDSSANSRSLYLAVANGLLYTPTEAEKLQDFVADGGHALLATKAYSTRLISPLLPDSCYAGLSGDLNYQAIDSLEIVLSAKGDSLPLPLLRKKKNESGAITVFYEPNEECEVSSKTLMRLLVRQVENLEDSTSLDDYWRPEPVLMASYPYGEGRFTLLSHPLLLTNIYATDPVGREVFEEVFDLIAADYQTVVYDINRRSSEYLVRDDNQPDYAFDGSSDSNILKHVLSRPALANAWYLLLLGAIAFVIFGARRRQRVIPLLQPKRNTTHEHLGNISRLYLSKPDNVLMANKQFAMFEAYCLRHFGLRPFKVEHDYQRMLNLTGVNAKSVETARRYHLSLQRNQALSNNGFVHLVRILQMIYRDLGRRYD